MISKDLRQLATEYVLAISQGDALTFRFDHLYQEMISSFGEVDTKIAVQEMEEVFKMIGIPTTTEIKWYVGLAIKDRRIV